MKKILYLYLSTKFVTKIAIKISSSLRNIFERQSKISLSVLCSNFRGWGLLRYKNLGEGLHYYNLFN